MPVESRNLKPRGSGAKTFRDLGRRERWTLAIVFGLTAVLTIALIIGPPAIQHIFNPLLGSLVATVATIKFAVLALLAFRTTRYVLASLYLILALMFGLLDIAMVGWLINVLAPTQLEAASTMPS